MSNGFRVVIVLFFLMSVQFLQEARGEQGPDVVENFPTGLINWTTGVVEARGEQAPAPQTAEGTADRVGALDEAWKLARAHLLSTVMGARLDARTTIAEVARVNPMILSEIEEMVETAPVVGQKYLSDGTIKVTVRLKLFGGFSQLVLPGEIKQIEPIKTVSTSERKPQPDPTGNGDDTGKSEPSAYSGLVVDARGLDIQPAMVTGLYSETGEEVYGPAFISREFAVQNGMNRYVQDLAAARNMPRVAGNPLIVKGLRTLEHGRSDIVISKADAARLRDSSAHISFLRQCRVLVVVDGPGGGSP